MNKIGIIFAMYEELEEMLKLVKLNKINKIYDLDFCEPLDTLKECSFIIELVNSRSNQSVLAAACCIKKL